MNTPANSPLASNYAQIMTDFYADLARGDTAAALARCADQMTFQVAGKSVVAGKFTRDTFVSGYLSPLKERSGGSWTLEIHDVLASDRHAVVLASSWIQSGGVKTQLRTAHVWRFEGGKPVAGYEYPRDLYQHDAVWSA